MKKIYWFLLIIASFFLVKWTKTSFTKPSINEELLITRIFEEKIWYERLPRLELPKEKRLSLFFHRVRKGESLWSISRRYGTDVSTILSLNELSGKSIYPGQILKVSNLKGLFYKVKKNETLGQICRVHNISLKNVIEANAISNPHQITAGTWIFLPGVKEVKEIKRFIFPVPGGRISSYFGLRRHPIFGFRLFHHGVDIRAKKGTPVLASAPGRVVFSGWKFGYGRLIIIRHADGLETYYSHNAENFVKKGEYVRQGERIAKVGGTGLTTGPHLHFEIRKAGRPVDPLRYISR